MVQEHITLGIVRLRGELERAVRTVKDLSNPSVLELSRRLDNLVYEYYQDVLSAGSPIERIAHPDRGRQSF